MKEKRDRLSLLTKVNLAWLVVVFVLGTWVAERTSISTLFAYLPQIIWLLPSLALFIVCAVKQKKRLVTWNGAFLFVFGWLLLGMTVPNVWSEMQGPEFTVMTFNIEHATEGWDNIQKLIEVRKPYLVCLQEANGPKRLTDAIANLPGYHVAQYGDLAIGCQDALSEVRQVPLLPGFQGALEARAPNGVKVVAVHFPAFAFGRVSGRSPLLIPGHMQSIGRLHQLQAAKLVELYGKEHDCMICGDFNGPPRGQAYRKMTSAFTDTFAYKGWGFGYTYPSTFPLIRIDYAFLTDIKPLGAEVIATTISDHRPVMFDMLLYRPT